jgi:hypothetical protein
LDNIYDFEPSALRARLLDERMRGRLAASLRYIFEQADGQLSVSPSRLETFLSRLAGTPVSPLAFSFYGDVVLALERDDLDDASRLFEALVALPEHPGGPALTPLDDPRHDAIAARYARFLDTNPDLPFEINPPSPAMVESCTAQIESAFGLMEVCDADLGAELRALLREIVLAAGSQNPKAHNFDGASSMMLWGGIIINAQRDDGPRDMVQMLAHEAAHNLLFGLCMDTHLLENDPEERHASPLRADPRPLEGIYHATFVLARMHRALHHLLEAPGLAPGEKDKMVKELGREARAFNDGLATLRKHAHLTDCGAAILDGAAAYMEAAPV